MYTPTLASRFGRNKVGMRSDVPLTDDQIRAVAPSIFADCKHASRSDRYTFIPTIDVLAGLKKEGFQPFMVAQGQSRIAGKTEYTKHLVRMRHGSGQIGTKPEANEIILINAVGPSVQGTFDDLTDDQWGTALDEGAMGMVRCVRAALPLLRAAEWARIVNFSAQSTQRQSPRLSAYTAAKAMVTSVSKNLSLFLAPDEILVNVVSPGSIASEALTGWAESVGVDGSDPYALMAAIDEHFGHPAHLPRAGLTDEIGPVVAFLASRRNSYMTGANVNVDGGSDFT